MRTMQEIFQKWRSFTNSCNAILNNKALRLRILRSREEHEKGFMFEPEPDDGFGLFFVYERPERLGFWMRNVPYDLDLVGLDSDLRVQEIRKLIANDERTVTLNKPSQHVLELRSGWCARNGIRPGIKLNLNDEI